MKTWQRSFGSMLAVMVCGGLIASIPFGCATSSAVSRSGHRAGSETVVTPAARAAAGYSGGVHPADFQRHIDILASDTMTGRGIGTPGIEMAAAYIAGQFASLGIEPGGEDGTYFQAFDMGVGSELVDDYAFNFSGVDVSPARGEDFTPFSFSSADAFEGDVVFAGYGITNEEKEHDDYEDLDVEGKVVLALRREPPTWGEGGDTTRHAMFQSKVYTAREHGAKALLIVNRVSDRGDVLQPFGMGGARGNYGMPAFHVTQALTEHLLAAGGLESLEALQATLDGGGIASAALSDVRLQGKAGIETHIVGVRNVLGVIPGEGPLADEYVVIGGHYDHLGFSRPQMPSFGKKERSDEPQIHNGADDNASGTAAVIESGRMLMNMRPLKRSVILMAFTGEESGLYGSKHYADNPTVAVEDIVAMLNLDMVGRLKGNGPVQVFGVKTADEFDALMIRLCEEAGLELRSSGGGTGPSDHTSFYLKKIPSMHFFSGLHSDYHRPGDDADKINADGGARVADLVVATACAIIEADARPTYHEVKEPSRMRSGRGGVVMGVMPAYMDGSDGKKGMQVDGVSPDGPAEKAGMKAGDRIVKIGKMDVAGVYDYMGAIRNNKPGDVVEVVVARGDNNVTLQVTLSGR